MAGHYDLTVEDIYGIVSTKDMALVKERGGISGIAKILDANVKKGLENNNADLDKRREAFGANTYPMPPSANWFRLFFDALSDVALIILIVAALVSLIAGIVEQVLGQGENHWIEGIAILVAVFIVATVGATNDYLQDQQFRKLKKQTSDRPVIVLRDGDESQISINDIVVGDIIVIHTGDKLPADGLLVPGFEALRVDESSMTGEPEEQTKNEAKPFLFSGTNVTKGAGRMLVMQVGANSEWGRTLAHLATDNEPTPLQDKLEAMVIFIGKIGVIVAIAVFVILIGYYIADFGVNPHRDDIVGVDCVNNSTGTVFNDTIPACAGGTYLDDTTYRVPTAFDTSSLFEILYAFIIAVTIIVVAIPEGLPLAVTISLAYSMRLMQKDNTLVRHLAACETMGGATNICSDKTGTLTQNRMAIVSGHIAGQDWDAVEDITMEKAIRRVLIDASCLNTEDGQLLIDEETGLQKFHGNPTECALLVFCKKLGANYKKIQNRNEAVYKWGFSSARKRMSTVVANRKKEGSYRLYCKGAAEMVLELCTQTLMPDGSVGKITKDYKKQMNEVIIKNAKKGLRNICLAYREFDESHDWASSTDGEGFEENLILIGIVSIEDPLRPEVPNAVKVCQLAGITVRMVTGDNVLTAKKIASDCFILTEEGIAMEGPDFRKLTDDEIDEILPTLQVLARSSPTDKHRLVTRLRAFGEVVAVTGDGTNDAPALHAADVGLAMGIAGTEVAKEAADIIILDDNFSTIVKSVKWGRCVFDNIRKFLQFQLTINIVALVTAFIGAVSRYGTPLTAVQLLWINLIMDSMAALALGTEKPTDDLLRRKPYGKTGKLLTWIMWRNILGQSVLQITAMCVILYAVNPETQMHLVFPWVRNGQDIYGPNTQYTMLFNTFVWLQIFNEINARKLGKEWNVFSGLWTNYVFVGVIIASAGIQAIIVEFGGAAINTNHLDWREWLVCLFIGFLSLPWGLLLRFIPVPLEFWEVVHDAPPEVEDTVVSLTETRDHTEEKVNKSKSEDDY